jgi:hypothetical protein
MEVTFTLPPNPFVRSGQATKHYLLMSMTDLEMNLGVHTTQEGFPFSDAIETLMLYEFRQLDT